MKGREIAVAGGLVIAASGAMAAPKPLHANQAAVIGGWTGPSAVQAIVLQPVTQGVGCIKLGARAIMLDDHGGYQTIYRVKPGRYAVEGASWINQWHSQYQMDGISRAKGDAWVVDLAPGVVTDLGVWSITSPYAHRYVPSDPSTAPTPGANEAASGVAPLRPAHWTKARIFDPAHICPPTPLP